MSDVLGKVFSIFIAVIVMFLSPLVYMHQRMESAEQLFLITECTSFVDSVCSTGYISDRSLNAFHSNLSQKNSAYEIEFLYERKDVALGTGDEIVVTESFLDEADIRASIEKEGIFNMARGDFLKVVVRKVNGIRLPYLPTIKSVGAYYGATVRG